MLAKPTLKVEFNWKDDIGTSNLLQLQTHLYEIWLRKWAYSESFLFYFKLTTTEATLSYEDRFFKIRVAFHALYFENEVGNPPIFLRFCHR